MKNLTSVLNDAASSKILNGDYSLRVLVCVILESFYKDLIGYIKNPYRTEREFYSYGYKVQYLIDFWEKDAEVFFTYLFGAEKAKRLMKKLSIQINQAKEIYKESMEYAIQVVNS